MRGRELALVAFVAISVSAVTPLAGQDVITPVPEPEINQDTWVLIEVWPLPATPHISFSAYFLDRSYKRNRSLCEAAKRALDRDQEVALGRDSDEEHDSYRLCLPLARARAEGYVRSRE